jgi:hypothetical protein
MPYKIGHVTVARYISDPMKVLSEGAQSYEYERKSEKVKMDIPACFLHEETGNAGILQKCAQEQPSYMPFHQSTSFQISFRC